MRPFFSVLLLGLAAVALPEGRSAVPVGSNPAVPAPPFVASAGWVSRIDGSGGVMMGIDVVEAGNFVVLRGKRIGLLTHGAGVDRRGVSTVDVLRRAPGVKLVALYAAEHGLYGQLPAEHGDASQLDVRTGLMVRSLYAGKPLKPTKAQLQGIDALVIDLQDIGVRSYTFAASMKLAMAGCFENNIEVIVLDRPNPLGGLKVNGPLLDSSLGFTGVAAFPVPYVHGLTIGELAELAAKTPGVLGISEEARLRGRLQVIRMVGWKRTMRWPETGLTWVATSPNMQSFAAIEGYAMTGLGCYLGNFRSGVGNQYIFRGISNGEIKPEALERELRALSIPGVQFRRVSVPTATGKPATGLYVEIVDWDAWRPTELSFYLMRLACKLEARNPFAFASAGEVTNFLHYVGSVAFFRDLVARGSRVDVDSYVRKWEDEDRRFQEESTRFWLYH
jgi:uncharacterized protein YbbC (DUF1343 family)